MIIMKIKNTVVRLIRQYRTRQQLQYLPLFLIEDIGKTPHEIKQELAKNSFKKFITNRLKQLLSQSLMTLNQRLSQLIKRG